MGEQGKKRLIVSYCLTFSMNGIYSLCGFESVGKYNGCMFETDVMAIIEL